MDYTNIKAMIEARQDAYKSVGDEKAVQVCQTILIDLETAYDIEPAPADSRPFPEFNLTTARELQAFIRKEVRKALTDELRASSVFAGMPVI